jgi:hypothetical protein
MFEVRVKEVVDIFVCLFFSFKALNNTRQALEYRDKVNKTIDVHIRNSFSILYV